LRRQLGKEVRIKYQDLGNIFTEFKKNSDNFIVKKWWKRNDYSASSKKGKTSAQNSE